MLAPFIRILDEQERDALSTEWDNIPADTDPTLITIEFACECDEDTYQKWNGLKQIDSHRFIIGVAGDGL